MSPGSALLAAALGVSVVALLAPPPRCSRCPRCSCSPATWLGSRRPRRPRAGGASARLARAATRRPALAIGAALLLLAACIPVLGLRTGAPAAQSLPSGSDGARPVRRRRQGDGRRLDGAVRDRRRRPRGAVTTAQRLATLERAQRKLSRDPAVRAVLGPGTIARSAARCAAPAAVRSPRGRRVRAAPAGGCAASTRTCRCAADGVESLRSSLSSANAAATRLGAARAT